MGKTSYKNAGELVDELSKKIAKLNEGTLDLTELDALVVSSRELYEQLIVLRYKAFDTYGTPESTVEQPIMQKEAEIEIELTPQEEEEKPEEAIFDFTGVIETPEQKKETTQPAFDFTSDTPTTPEKPEIPEPPKEEIKKIPPYVSDIEEEDNETESSNSLNNFLKKEDDFSLRKKLQNTPISDIKAHIGIAKKFEYISAMFNGDAAAYEDAIDFLNTCASGKDAQLKLNELVVTYKWDLEDKSILKFTELVERRYL